jgi:hypothetical protein
MGLLQLLQELFGKNYLNKIIGTGTNVSKPIKLDKNSPFKLYSDKAFKDPEVLAFIEKKLAEYGPYVLSNKNMSEVKNFEMNARRLITAKQPKKESTVKSAVESMFGPLGKKEKPEINPELLKMTDDKLNALAKEGNALQAKKVLTDEERKRLDYIGNLLEDAQKLPDTGKGLTEDLKAAGFKPEAEVVDIRTKQKVDDTGIMKLKSELGLPEGVEPGSIADKAIKESVEYKTKQQGVKSVLDKDYVPPKTTSIDEDEIADIGARGYSAAVEGKRRAVIRQVLLKDARIDLPDDVRNSLKNYDDLRGGADENMDPLKVFDNYYERDNEILGELDSIIDTARNEREAADTFLSMEDNFKPKDLGTKLKDYDGDPDGLAEGGRIGFKMGKLDPKPGEPGRKEFLERKLEEAELSGDPRLITLDERDELMMLQTEELAPQMTERMQLKIRYPGITDDLIKKIMIDDNPQRKAEVLATMDEAFKMMDKGMSI